MIFKLAGGIAFILLALPLLGISAVPAVITGIFCLVAGVALISGQ